MPYSRLEVSLPENPPPAAPPAPGHSLGVLYGVSAYLWWGLVPIYFKAVSEVPAWEVLAHRVVWSFGLLLVLLLAQHDWPAFRKAWVSRRILVTLGVTTLLIAANWLLFIWAVEEERVVDASLGYFINPLVNVALGMAFLGERVEKWKAASVALALAGVIWLTILHGKLPWLSLSLALTFGVYGLLRKKVPVGALPGLAVETALLTPLALGYLVLAGAGGTAVFGSAWRISLLLAFSGVVTAVPLLWFAGAARRLQLATLGFLQYLAPTLQFLLAVLLYGEPFRPAKAAGFAFIWAGLSLYAIKAAKGATSVRALDTGTGRGPVWPPSKRA